MCNFTAKFTTISFWSTCPLNLAWGGREGKTVFPEMLQKSSQIMENPKRTNHF
jgi:hypothetical protein